MIGEILWIGSVRIHRVDFVIPIPVGGEGDFLPSGDQAGRPEPVGMQVIGRMVGQIREC